jgi:hypothetical protein
MPKGVNMSNQQDKSLQLERDRDTWFDRSYQRQTR